MVIRKEILLALSMLTVGMAYGSNVQHGMPAPQENATTEVNNVLETMKTIKNGISYNGILKIQVAPTHEIQLNGTLLKREDSNLHQQAPQDLTINILEKCVFDPAQRLITELSKNNADHRNHLVNLQNATNVIASGFDLHDTERAALQSIGIKPYDSTIVFKSKVDDKQNKAFHATGLHSPFMTAGYYIDRGLSKTATFAKENKALSAGLGLCALGLIGYSTLLYQGRTAPGMDVFKKYIANNAKNIFNSAAAKTIKGGLKTANSYTFGALYNAAANRFDKLFPVVR